MWGEVVVGEGGVGRGVVWGRVGWCGGGGVEMGGWWWRAGGRALELMFGGEGSSLRTNH